MTPIKYVGLKPVKTDGKTSFGTGIVWEGPGDVKMVEDVIAAQMITKYPEIWALADAVESAEDSETSEDETEGEEDPPGVEDADPQEKPEDFANMHWASAVKYINECSIEELQDLVEIEKTRKPKPRMQVLSALQDRLL